MKRVMAAPLILALVSAGTFLGLAYTAVNTPRDQFLRGTNVMGLVAVLIAVVAPFAGAALLGPVVLSRRLANAPVPATVPELLDRYPRR